MTATCRSCRAPVAWAVTAAGKRIPLDPEPVLDGNVVLDAVQQEGTSLERRVARVLRQGEEMHPDRLRYVSHFATCPRAAEHRRPPTTVTTPAGAVPPPPPAPAAPCTVWRDGALCGATPTRRYANATACRLCADRLSLRWPVAGQITPGQRLREQRAREAAAKAEIRTLLDSTGGVP